ncbi:hypothetical protein BDZ91DRAFT_800682 [Kalaharituber pfeilii]|nr:hypothetical protein BDZ91DRAFT_800682 [Kalaharituber pfeilii]
MAGREEGSSNEVDKGKGEFRAAEEEEVAGGISGGEGVGYATYHSDTPFLLAGSGCHSESAHLLPQSGRAIVVHGIAVTKKLGKVRDWMENTNPWMGKIVAARWLVKKERREGKKASSIVIYLEGEVESDSQTPAKVRLSGKWYDSCLYDWDRNSKVDRKGKGREVEEMDLTA